MTQVGIMQAGVATHNAPLLRRFLAKLVIDVMPAVLTSVIGGFLITQYQFNRAALLRPAAEQATPATADMVQLVRDEHTAIMDYLKEQIAAEKSRNAAADAADARAAAAARATPEAPSAAGARAAAAVPVTAKSGVPHTRPVVTILLPPHEPLKVAQAAPTAPASAVPPAQQPRSLLATTLDIKDHVVGATWHVVSAIGGIPSWIASIGDHRDADTTPDKAGPSFSS